MTASPTRPVVRVVGLGPGPTELITGETRAILADAAHRFVRTTHHPSSGVVSDAQSFDHVYDTHATFEDVYRGIVDDLVRAAETHGEVVYAVPGSPMVAERSVELLLQDSRVDVEVHPAVSFLDLVWTRLRVDPLTAGVRFVDGHRFGVESAGERGPLLVGQCHSLSVLSEIKLAFDGEDGGPQVTVLQRVGLPDEAVFTLPWDELDRAVVPDHLTSLYIPSMAAPVASELSALAEITRTLRERCPWDSAQTHESLAKYVVEEAYEVVEAIDGLAHADAEPAVIDHFMDELGDVLLQVLLHSCIAAEQGWFTVADVAREQREKLIRRHPHVFPPDGPVDGMDASELSSLTTADEVAANWERIKAGTAVPAVGAPAAPAPQARAGALMDGVPKSLPALLYANEVLKRVGRAGHDHRAQALASHTLTDMSVVNAVTVGDALLDLVAHARSLGVDAEVALRAATARLRDTALGAR